MVAKHQLRSAYTAIYPGVYVRSNLVPTFADHVEAAWLWSRRNGVIAGLTAARLYGAKWVDDDMPVELVWPNARPPKGIRTSVMTLGPGETVLLGGYTVTSLSRTAFDLARRKPLGAAVARLDALAGAARFDCSAVRGLAASHRGTRGVRHLERALDLHDPGAQSPRETWLRLLVIGSGFPRPRTQIRVRSKSGRTYYLDMGWEELKIAIEYDGDQHRTDRSQFAKDIVRLEELAELGWTVIRVSAGTTAGEVVDRLSRAWAARGAVSM